MMNNRKLAEQIFLAAIEKVLPKNLIKNELEIVENTLIISQIRLTLNQFENIYIIGAGKASALMALEVEKILGKWITNGYVVVKYGHSCKLEKITVREAGHPNPDYNGIIAATEILKIAAKAKEEDLIICLLSGGGSSLLADFPAGSSLEEIIVLNDLLLKSGASIYEINIIRKHLSGIKGGQLSRAFYPATIVSLILSDVTGDSPEIIASGPTSPDSSTFTQSLELLEKYGITKSVPKGILNYLIKGKNGKIAETPKQGDFVFSKTFNKIIGNNIIALEAAKSFASEKKINTAIICNNLNGDISKVPGYIIETALRFKNDKSALKPVCLLFGGEPTIKITGSGLGGRNQHLALLCGTMIRNEPGITILAAGTDGNDGQTDAAGAIVDSELIDLALKMNVNPQKYIEQFDSYHFFKRCGGHIITGPTFTNVMDIVIVIVE